MVKMRSRTSSTNALPRLRPNSPSDNGSSSPSIDVDDKPELPTFSEFGKCSFSSQAIHTDTCSMEIASVHDKTACASAAKSSVVGLARNALATAQLQRFFPLLHTYIFSRIEATSSAAMPWESSGPTFRVMLIFTDGSLQAILAKRKADLP